MNSLPTYFLHVRYKPGPDGLAVDTEGDELPDAGALRDHVLVTARDMLRGPRLREIEWASCTMEVTDAAGRLVLTLPFSEAADAPDGGGIGS
jgi:hypothetical protein